MRVFSDVECTNLTFIFCGTTLEVHIVVHSSILALINGKGLILYIA